jgi:hypothetical protein
MAREIGQSRYYAYFTVNIQSRNIQSRNIQSGSFVACIHYMFLFFLEFLLIEWIEMRHTKNNRFWREELSLNLITMITMLGESFNFFCWWCDFFRFITWHEFKQLKNIQSWRIFAPNWRFSPSAPQYNCC